MTDGWLLGLPHWVVVLIEGQEGIMSLVDELNVKVDELKAAQDAAAGAQQARDEAQAAALERVAIDVAYLKSLVGAGVDVGPALARLEASVQAAKAGQAKDEAATAVLGGLDPVPENP